MNKVMSQKKYYPVNQENDWGFYIDIERCHSSNNNNDEIMRAKYKVIADRYYHKYELNKNKIEMDDTIKKIEMNDEIYSDNQDNPDKSHSLLFNITSLTITFLSCYYILWIL